MARKEDYNNAEQMSLLTANLGDAVTTARQRLMKFGEYVRVDETRTRMFIIDAILNGLGWQVLDPQLVLLEHRENGNTMDYVLMIEGKRHLVVVEAKRSQDLLNDGHRRQASGYAVELATKYAVLTNGARWEAWNMNTGKPRRDSMIAEVNITTGDIEEIVSQLMPLHREMLGIEE